MLIQLYLSTILLLSLTTHGQLHHNIAVIYQEDNLSDEDISQASNYTNTHTDAISVVYTYHQVSKTDITDSIRTVCQKIKEAYGGIVTFLDCPTAKYVDYFTNSLGIPHILHVLGQCHVDGEGSSTLKLSYDCFTNNAMMSSILQNQKWRNVVIIYDDITYGKCMQDLLVSFSKQQISSRLIKLNGTEDATRYLSIVHELKAKHFVIMVRDDVIDVLLQQIHGLNMFTETMFWIASVSQCRSMWEPPSYMNSSHFLVTRRKTLAPCGCLRTSLPIENYTLKGVYLQDAAMVYMDAFTKSQAYLHNISETSTNCTDLRTNKSKYLQSVIASMRQTHIEGLTGQLEFQEDGFPKQAVYEVISSRERGNTSSHIVATWDTRSGLTLSQDRLFLNTFSDFDNRTLIIATQEAKPFTIRNVINGSVVFTGFCFDILDELANRFKFRYKIVEPPDGFWGGPNKDGTWNGMVGMVMRGEIDFAIGPFTITSLREQVIDFTKPYMEDGAGIITKRPDGESNKIFQMFRPFAGAVWGCIAIATLCVGILLYIVNRFSPYTAYNRRLIRSSPEEISLSGNMWLIFGAFVEQGGVFFPTAISGRCILGFWWVFTILITSTYTANLAAFLTVTIAEKPINSLNELVAQDEIKPLVKTGTNIYSLFQEADSGIYKTIWSMMSDMPVIKDTVTALGIVREGGTAYMTDRTQLEYIVLNDCQTYALADEVFNTAGYGFVVPEKAPFLDSFNYNIMRMQEAGLIEKWRMEWWPRSDRCNGPSRTSSAQTLGLDSLAGPFLVYASVAVLSFFCLIAEIFLQSRSRNNKKTPSTQKPERDIPPNRDVPTNGHAKNGFY